MLQNVHSLKAGTSALDSDISLATVLAKDNIPPRYWAKAYTYHSYHIQNIEISPCPVLDVQLFIPYFRLIKK